MYRLLRCLPFACLLLTACGQTGALYLPGQEPPRQHVSARPDLKKPSEEKPAALPGDSAPDTPAGQIPLPTSTQTTTPAAPAP